MDKDIQTGRAEVCDTMRYSHIECCLRKDHVYLLDSRILHHHKLQVKMDITSGYTFPTCMNLKTKSVYIHHTYTAEFVFPLQQRKTMPVYFLHHKPSQQREYLLRGKDQQSGNPPSYPKRQPCMKRCYLSIVQNILGEKSGPPEQCYSMQFCREM